MDDRHLQFLRAVCGEQGAQALKKAVDQRPELAGVLVPRAALAWVGVLCRTEHDGVIPGTDKRLVVQKSEPHAVMAWLGKAGWGPHGAAMQDAQRAGLDHIQAGQRVTVFRHSKGAGPSAPQVGPGTIVQVNEAEGLGPYSLHVRDERSGDVHEYVRHPGEGWGARHSWRDIFVDENRDFRARQPDPKKHVGGLDSPTTPEEVQEYVRRGGPFNPKLKAYPLSTYNRVELTPHNPSDTEAGDDESWTTKSEPAYRVAARVIQALGVVPALPSAATKELAKLGKAVDVLVRLRAMTELRKAVLDPAQGYRMEHDEDRGELTVIARDRTGRAVGHAVIVGGRVRSVQVEPQHRRQGLASAMYAHAEKITGRKVQPSGVQTPDGKALWAANGRQKQFGKSEGDPGEDTYEARQNGSGDHIANGQQVTIMHVTNYADNWPTLPQLDHQFRIAGEGPRPGRIVGVHVDTQDPQRKVYAVQVEDARTGRIRLFGRFMPSYWAGQRPGGEALDGPRKGQRVEDPDNWHELLSVPVADQAHVAPSPQQVLGKVREWNEKAVTGKGWGADPPDQNNSGFYITSSRLDHEPMAIVKTELPGQAAKPAQQSDAIPPDAPSRVQKKPAGPQKPQQLRMSEAQLCKSCGTCGGRPQLKDGKLRACLCWGDLTSDLKLEKSDSGYLVSFGRRWDQEALAAFLAERA